jgi:maleamate amidohydrolase
MPQQDRVWDRFLTEQDRAHLAVAGGRPRQGFGDRAAVISVDNYRNAVGDEPLPLLESMRTWPSSTGLAGWTALEHISTLFGVARESGVPIVHITGLNQADSGMAGWIGRDGASGAPGAGAPKGASATGDDAAADRARRKYDIVEQAAPQPGEVVLRKTGPSSFFGTPLMGHLNSLRVDTLIVCGESTSGCVRATVVDGRAYRFRVIVVEECVYDRHEATHAINLFDMDQKYADVLGLAEVTGWMRSTGAARPTP